MARRGKWIRQMREDLHLRPSDIVRLTARIAEFTGNDEFRVGRGRLTNLEKRDVTPNILTGFALAACLRRDYRELLEAYGVNPDEARDFLAHSPFSIATDQRTGDAAVERRALAISFARQFDPDETTLVPETDEDLVVLRAVFGLEEDQERYRFGVIGLKDDRMNPLVPAGSKVLIDKVQNTVELSEWRNLLERQIYFVWHDKGYSCGWCYQERDTLILLPYPTSHRPAMILKMSRGTTIIGRVVHVWPPLMSSRLGTGGTGKIA